MCALRWCELLTQDPEMMDQIGMVPCPSADEQAVHMIDWVRARCSPEIFAAHESRILQLSREIAAESAGRDISLAGYEEFVRRENVVTLLGRFESTVGIVLCDD